MKLLIHDLKGPDSRGLLAGFDGWETVSDDGAIRPCAGCFCCWHKTPGRCVLRDGYGNMGELVHRAEEVTVVSRYTYGGFSGFVKNVIDRCLGYVLPQFEMVNGETHHQKRYREDKPFTFVFYGPPLTEAEKDSARRYVTAVCTNFRSRVKEVVFRETETAPPPPAAPGDIPRGKVLLLNGSMRYARGNSARLSRALAGMLHRETEIAALCRNPGETAALLSRLAAASDLVLCLPLYVDGLPSQVIRFMELAEREYRGEARRVYVLANMGLYESRQLVNLFEAVRQWCGRMGFVYAGALGVSAGELIGTLLKYRPIRARPMTEIARGMERLARAIDGGAVTEDIYTEPAGFPRCLYILIANENWNRLAKKNGLKPKELYRKL